MIIRELKKNEIKVLKDFLYEAIYIPKGIKKPSKDIINKEELKLYYDNFYSNKDDYCLVCIDDNKIVGAVWTRIMNDYGHIDDNAPSLAISLYEEYRGKGYGTKLMINILELLKNKGYKNVSLSVQKENYATKLYLNVGFKIINETEEEYIMVKEL
jgi:ribosomal protein S18 acetylase RimI-like enzyme